MHLILCLLFSYLMGSIPVSLIIGKVFFNKDVRKYGSKNLGGTNAGRVLGKAAGVSVIFLDHLKAILAILLVTLYVNNFAPNIVNLAIYLSSICIILGHCYPIFANFKGGKAVACTYGILFITNIYLYVIAALTFLLILKLSKYVSLSSVCSIFIAALISLIPIFRYSPFLSISFDIYYSILILIIASFVLFKHKANIIRLKNGTENKIKWMK